MAASAHRRFDNVREEDLNDFIYSMDSDNTKKQIKYGMSVFGEFCKEVEASFDDIDGEGLDLLLSQFYAGARNKKGELYRI